VARVVQAPRAASILFNLLRSRPDARPWLIPANVCPIVPVTYAKAGVPFELVDVDPDTLHLDLERAAGRIQRGRFGGLLYVHTYGEPSTPRQFFEHVKGLDPELLVVDDRCLCSPDLDEPPPSGADVVLYSSGYGKQVDLGAGGYAFLRDNVEYRLVSLPFDAASYQALERSYKASIHERSPFTYRDSDWLQTDSSPVPWGYYRQQVADELNRWRAHRARLRQIYTQTLPLELQLPEPYQSWRFNVRLKDRPRVVSAIFSAGLFASHHYASLTGIMGPGKSPHAECLADEVVNLFIDRHFTEDQATRTAALILANLR
jgi:hypothetical protein